MNYTKNTLQKIEELFGELGYSVRYEKGSFQSGYAIVQAKKIAVVNKFFETEARINALFDIFDQVEAQRNAEQEAEQVNGTTTESWEKNLSEKSQKLVKQIRNYRRNNEQSEDQTKE